MEAFAKINLFLDVLGKRIDGYHDILSVMIAVDLCDELVIKKSDGSRDVQFFCDDPLLPGDETNLVVKAAKILRDYGLRDNLEIALIKRIPFGAGLAGGSSDCAATLLGINALCNLQIPFATLLEIGKSLGADVPFCLTGGAALTEGIGEKITPLFPIPPCFIVIACPEIHVSTAQIFSRLGTLEPRKSPEKILAAIYKKNLREISSSLYNIFTPITAGFHPEISNLISQFQKLGALGAEMSGTGSSVFAIFDNEKTALAALNKMKTFTDRVFLTKPKLEKGLEIMQKVRGGNV